MTSSESQSPQQPPAPDPATGTYPSTVYPSMFGTPIPLPLGLDGDELTSTTDMLAAVFHGRRELAGAPPRAREHADLVPTA